MVDVWILTDVFEDDSMLKGQIIHCAHYVLFREFLKFRQVSPLQNKNFLQELSRGFYSIHFCVVFYLSDFLQGEQRIFLKISNDEYRKIIKGYQRWSTCGRGVYVESSNHSLCSLRTFQGVFLKIYSGFSTPK